ncbi:MAG: hypothetical protein RKP46_11050, partial [Candidatus Accumulibacter sp.]|uniref:hypothetical protein n=1 Tax=Accumulibacter sp. TaxID=2053492 RepID=UPI002879C4A4
RCRTQAPPRICSSAERTRKSARGVLMKAFQSNVCRKKSQDYRQMVRPNASTLIRGTSGRW